MKKVNKIGLVLILIITAIVLTSEAYALGITPGRKTIFFEPELHKEVSVAVLNNEHKSFTATIYARGELSNYVNIPISQLEFSSSDDSKSFVYEINLPEKFEEPGLHQADIVVREISPVEEGEVITIDTLVAVVSNLQVNVPYPGKFLRANLDIVGANIGEEVKFFIRLYNLGEERIDKAKATIFIYDANNNEVARVESDEKAIAIKSIEELKAKWIANTAGSYRAVAVVDYDGKTTKEENKFLVGDFFLKLIDISVKDFKLGGIAKFNILVENIRDTLIKESYSEMMLYDNNGKEIMNIRNSPIDIEAGVKKEMIAYWDTEGVEKGFYEGKIILNYEENSLEHRIRTQVKEDEIKVEIIGITGAVIGVGPGLDKHSVIVLVIIISIIVIGIGMFVYPKKKSIRKFINLKSIKKIKIKIIKKKKRKKKRKIRKKRKLKKKLTKK